MSAFSINYLKDDDSKFSVNELAFSMAYIGQFNLQTDISIFLHLNETPSLTCTRFYPLKPENYVKHSKINNILSFL